MMMTIQLPSGTAQPVLPASTELRDVVIGATIGGSPTVAIAESSIQNINEGALLRDANTRFTLLPGKQLWALSSTGETISVIASPLPIPGGGASCP
jgi:hypothetical protein